MPLNVATGAPATNGTVRYLPGRVSSQIGVLSACAVFLICTCAGSAPKATAVEPGLLRSNVLTRSAGRGDSAAANVAGAWKVSWTATRQ